MSRVVTDREQRVMEALQVVRAQLQQVQVEAQGRFRTVPGRELRGAVLRLLWAVESARTEELREVE